MVKKCYCIKCGKLLNEKAQYTNAKLCRNCYNKNMKGKNHPRFKDGRCSKQYFCRACGVKIYYATALYSSGLCMSCVRKDKKSQNYIDGRCSKQYYCIDCGKKLSSYQAKRCVSCKQKGKLNFQYIDGRTKKKYYCKGCGKEITISSGVYGTGLCLFCIKKEYSEEHRKKISLAGGGTGIPYEFAKYPEKFNDNFKDSIRARDNYTCQLCGTKQEDYYRALDVHHIDYNKKDCNPNNLITLCHNCHGKTNYNRKYWTEYFLKQRLYKINGELKKQEYIIGVI